MEIQLAKLTNKDIADFCALISLFEDVFEWQNFSFPSKPHLQKVLDNPAFIVFVAKAGQQVLGGLTAYVLESYETEKPSAYIYDLAVLRSVQRKGIGKSLIEALNNYCHSRGFKEVYVQADIEDGHAIDFYRATAATSEIQAVHFTYLLSKIQA